MRTLSRTCYLLIFAGILCSRCSRTESETLPDFPEGWVDSPFITPDGSTLYFMHSVADIADILSQNPQAKPVARFLPGHVGSDGKYWWNADLYLSRRNKNGTWSWPENLGPPINTYHIENCPWVNNRQTVIIFRREAVDGDPSVTGTYMATRSDPSSPWGMPVKLPSNIGDRFTNHHLTPSGALYFESADNQSLYWASPTAENSWSDPVPLTALNSDLMDTQLWIDSAETVIYFNRRNNDGNTRLYRSARSSITAKWSEPQLVNTENFNPIWGEPGITLNDTLFFVMGIKTYLYRCSLSPDGFCGIPKKLHFE